MTSLVLRRWAAWAPGRETPESWAAWAAAPVPLAGDGHPDAAFLPAMLRRRCTPLSRIVLTAAFGCCPAAEQPEVRTVFASRHGSINESIGLLEAVVRSDRISPAKFSHTVHNAQAGLFSIAAANRCASSSLSAGADTFPCAWIEAATHVQREPDRAVLLVMADVPLADTFAPLVDEAAVPYALALLVAAAGEGSPLTLSLQHGSSTSLQRRPWPDALEFLRWVLGEDPTLEFEVGPRRWSWRRGIA